MSSDLVREQFEADSHRNKRGFLKEMALGNLDLNLLDDAYPLSAQEQNVIEEFKQKIAHLASRLDFEQIEQTNVVPGWVWDYIRNEGFTGLLIPKEYGGIGLSKKAYGRILRTATALGGAVCSAIMAHCSIGVGIPILYFGTEEQKRRYLPKIAKGWISGFALTEPSAGSDPGSMKLRAYDNHDGAWTITGATKPGHSFHDKLWCTNGPIADVILVMATVDVERISSKTGTLKKERKVTAFIFETRTPDGKRAQGFSVPDWPKVCQFMGCTGLPNGLLRFENCIVPAENILRKNPKSDGIGDGLAIALTVLDGGRLGLPSQNVGTSEQLLARARIFSNVREQWGGPICMHEFVQRRNAQMARHTAAAKAVSDLSLALADKGDLDFEAESAAGKYFCTERTFENTGLAFRTIGGRAYERNASLIRRGEMPISAEQIYRDQPISLTVEGTNDIQKMILTKGLLMAHKQRSGSAGGILGAIPWYLGAWLHHLLPHFRYTIQARSLSKQLSPHLDFVYHTQKRLSRKVFHRLLRIGVPAFLRHRNMRGVEKELMPRQWAFERFVEIFVELYAMVAIIWAAEKRTPEGMKGSAREVADAYCAQARERIQQLFREDTENFDKADARIASLLSDGKLSYLEEDIIPPLADYHS